MYMCKKPFSERIYSNATVVVRWPFVHHSPGMTNHQMFNIGCLCDVVCIRFKIASRQHGTLAIGSCNLTCRVDDVYTTSLSESVAKVHKTINKHLSYIDCQYISPIVVDVCNVVWVRLNAD